MRMELLLGDDISMKLLLSWEKPAEPEPAYDETKIAVIELDENDEPTGVYTEYDSIELAAKHLLSDPDTAYMMRIGDNCTAADTISDNAFNKSYASSKYSMDGNFDNLHKVYFGFTREIGASAFQACRNIRSVEFMQIIVIKSQAFLHCAIERLDFPASLAAIYNGAFTQQYDEN